MWRRSKNQVELLKASLKGSTQAFESVVGEYQSLVCAITYGATANLDKSEELAQEVFLRAWKNLAQLKDLTKFRPWLCSIARSTVQNWFRSQKHDMVGKAAPLDGAADKACEASGPVEAAMIKEEQAVVGRALAQIPDSLREPLILFYREQQSIRQVAQQLGLSENAARQRISRGRNMLREQVAAVVETTIARTKPGKAFTTAVIATIAAAAVKSTTTAAAATHATASTGGSLGTATLVSSLGAKIAALAAAVVIVTGGLVAYRHLTRPDGPVGPPAATGPVQGQRRTGGDPTNQAITDGGVREGMAGQDAARIDTSRTPTPLTADTADSTETTGTARRIARSETRAEPSPFEPKGVLSGLITDIDTGEPVRDAVVRIEFDGRFESRADANGFYSFDKIGKAGSHRIWVASKEYVGITRYERAAALYLSEDKETVHHFQLPKACMVDVWVTDPNGSAIEDARVVATSLADDRSQEITYFGQRGETDPNGYILLGGFPPAKTEYLITVWQTIEVASEERDGRRYARTEYAYAPAGAAVQLTDPNVIEQIRIVLEEGQEAHGYAEYADGVPATDIGIVPRPVWWHCSYGVKEYIVAPDGTFTLKHIVPGTYSICMSVSRPDNSGRTVSGVTQAQLPPADGQPLIVKLPGNSPQTLVSISGKIVFVGERKPATVSISAYSPTGGRGFTHLGRRNGQIEDTFVLNRLEPGTYRLSFFGGDIEKRVLDNVEAPTAALEVELVYAAKPKLKGTVVDGQTGEPIKSFRVRARKLSALRGPNYAQQDQWVHIENERGYFTTDAVGPGIYQVQIAAEGYALTWSKEINTDQADLVEVSLASGGTVTGRVVDEQGQAITGARVIPLSIAGGVMPRTKDVFVCEDGAVETAAGAFTLPHLPAGTETLKVTHPDYTFAVVEGIEAIEGRTTSGVEIVLTTGGTVEGYVYDEKGDPLANEVLYFQDDSGYGGAGDEEAGRLATVSTNREGSYRASHLPEQLCYAVRANEWSRMGVVRRTVAPRNGRVMRLDFGGTPLVSGAVVIDGAPLTKTRLLLGPATSPHFGIFRCYTTTDKLGTFVFPGAARGTHAIYYEGPGKQSEWLKIVTVTVTDVDMDLGVIGSAGSEVLVTVNTPDSADPARQIEQVFISDRNEPFAPPLRRAQPPVADNASWLIDNVEAGTYTLTVVRADQLRWRTQIVLEPGHGPWQISLDAPEATARVSGQVRGTKPNWLALWQQDRSVWTTIRLAEDATFTAENLPAGTYLIGPDSAFLFGLPATAEITLGQGQSKTLDVDLTDETKPSMARLSVQVVDENGRLRDDAKVWLAGPLQVTEPERAMGGQYAFVAPPHEHILHVEAPGYSPVTRQVTLKPFEARTDKRHTVLVRLEKR